jgi:hypothetical protein
MRYGQKRESTRGLVATHTLDGHPAIQHLLWWQKRGLSFTRSGYGSRIPTSWMVHVKGKWRRVYCCIWSNIGTCYIGKSILPDLSNVVRDNPVPIVKES